jgi:hypothetical protein
MHKNGYLTVHLGAKVRRLVHRLVFAAFRGLPLPPEVDHADRDRGNCVLSNLAPTTIAANRASRLVAKGDRHGKARLTETLVMRIRGLAASGERHAVIATRVGVTSGHIDAIVARRYWKHVR